MSLNKSSILQTAFRSRGEKSSHSPHMVNVMFRLSIKYIYIILLCCCRGSNPSENIGGNLVPYIESPISLTNRISAAPRSSCSSSKMHCSRSHKRDRCSHSSCCRTAKHNGAWDCPPYYVLKSYTSKTCNT